MRLLALLALLAAPGSLLAAPAGAAEGDWPVLAFAQDRDCRLEVTGNGQIFLIAASGLGDGAHGRYSVTNGDMQPIDWTITATPGGRIARYYKPFRWHREGGQVSVTVETARCRVSASFPWKRGIRVIG